MKIVYTTSEGYLAILTPSQELIDSDDFEELLTKDIPEGVTTYSVEDSELPTQTTFRDAWKISGKNKITIEVDLDKAKELTHQVRRQARALELKQYDIEATVPSLSEQAEANRQIIRDKYATIQDSIDNAEDVESLEAVLKELM